MNLPMYVSLRTSIGPVKVVRHRVVPQFEPTGFWEAETFSKRRQLFEFQLGAPSSLLATPVDVSRLDIFWLPPKSKHGCRSDAG
jgi:hypothetical protein